YVGNEALRDRSGASAGQEVAAQTVDSYCVDCHDAATKSGGVVLDADQLAEIGAHAEVWEKVVRKLESGTMPPPGEPRPPAESYPVMAGFRAGELDAAAALAPNPGRLPRLHRLTRTEYQNAMRDLLALDGLPDEMDYTL